MLLFSFLRMNKSIISICIAVLLLAACTAQSQSAATQTISSQPGNPSDIPSSEPATQTSQLSTGPTITSPATCIPTGTVREQGTVTRVVDGDTIHVKINGRDYSIRYIGIDTPEDTTEHEYFGPEATQANDDLVGGQKVTLIRDVSNTDKYNRLLRYVFVGDLFVNDTLVRTGYARAATFPPDVACSESFLQAEREARDAGLGLWK